VAHELVPEEIEIHPHRVAAAFAAAEHVPVETARFGEVSHLHSDVKWSQSHD
jgi:hypothetical protein